MQQRRTRHFKITLLSVLGASALFLLCLALFGKAIALSNFTLILDCVFAVMVLAVASFLAFSFMPYFHGDKRWYSISALLTAVFFVGAVILWQVPVTGAMIG